MLAELSMGMSHDFEVAIEEGATMVRVGTAIFGSRPIRSDPGVVRSRPRSRRGNAIRSCPSAVDPAGEHHECQPSRPAPATFPHGLRGFDKIEVTSFLAAVADDYEQALRETDRLRQDLARMEAVLNEHREHEKNLRSTLLTAQRLSDDIKAQRRAGSRAASSVKPRAASTCSSRRRRPGSRTFSAKSTACKLKRKDVETRSKRTIQTLRNTLEFVREQEAREREDKILLHRPRHAEPAADTRDAHDALRAQGLP